MISGPCLFNRGLLVALIFSGCASHRPEISGDFGSVAPPNNSQVALLRLKSGKEIVARKLQEEDDTVFAQNLDFSISPIPVDSVAGIEIRERNQAEQGSLNVKPGAIVKDVATSDMGLHAIIWLVAAVPVLILGILVSGYLMD